MFIGKPMCCRKAWNSAKMYRGRYLAQNKVGIYMPIVVSVVVCTRNRVDSLRRCVQALASINTGCEWELVIVDNGSDDGTSAFLTSLPQLFSKTPVITTFEPKRGLAAARNRGVDQAHGDIVAFTDDDCYVFDDYIDLMVSAFENPELVS